jgi:hypothetical protein
MAHRSTFQRCCILVALLVGTAVPLSALAQDGYPQLITLFETNKAPANPAQYEPGETIVVSFSVSQDANVQFIHTDQDGVQTTGEWFSAKASEVYYLEGVAVGESGRECKLTVIADVGVPGVPGSCFCEVQDLYYMIAGEPGPG